MRVANRHQHPLHLQVTRNSNGKFFVSSNPQDQQQLQQQHPQSLQQQQPPLHHNHRSHHHYHHHLLQAQQAQSPSGDDVGTTPVAPVAFPTFEPNNAASETKHGPTILGDRFLLIGPAEGSTLYRCIDTQTGQHLICKPLKMGDKSADALLQAHLRLEGTGATSSVAGVVDAGRKRYLLLEGHYGDLHAYVRARRRLREPEARRLFKQAAKAVAKCHDNGVVLRDLKLRKFVFADEGRTKLRLESLEDAVLVDADDDKLSDRRGCPAYVAPEVLRSGRAYSGKAADIWSLGVLLYTMLVGRYPFNDAEHASLFAKISRGHFAVPDALGSRSRCLVRALLRREPSERPVAEDVLRHPWLAKPLRPLQIVVNPPSCHVVASQNVNINGASGIGAPGRGYDQIVPEQS